MKILQMTGNTSPGWLNFNIKLRLSTFFFLFLLLSLQAKSFSQGDRITLDVTNIALEKVMDEIDASTDYKFFFKTIDVDLQRRVTLNVKEAPIEDVLQKVFGDTDVDFRIKNRKIYLRTKKKSMVKNSDDRKSMESAVQELKVTGRIKDENGNPLMGASILEKGTTNGTTTDADGNFEITVTDGDAVLVISYIGFKTFEAPVSGTNFNNVRLAEDTAQLSQVVVRSYRQRNERVLALKQNSPVIADFLAQDNLGQLPDFNVAEALGRVPGISTEQSRGEDRFVTVRGIRSALNFVSIDGAIIPGTDENDRAVPLDILPSSLVTAVAVNKSFTADMDANAIGSNIELRTRSAFDTKKRFFLADAFIGKYDQDDGPVSVSPSITSSLTYANRIGENWGFVVSGSYYNRENYTNLPAVTSGLWDWYDEEGTRFTDPFDPSHNGYPVPTGQKAFFYFNDRERFGGFGKLEYRKNSFYAFADVIHYKFKDNERRYETLIDRDRGVAPLNQTPTSGLQTSASMQTAVIDQLFDFSVTAFQSEVRFSLGNHDFKLGANRSNGKYDQPFTWDKFNSPRTEELGYTYNYEDPVNSYPIITFTDPSFYDDASNFRHLYHREIGRNSEEDIFETRLDYDWEIPNSNFVLSAGLKTRNLDRSRDRFQNEWNLINRDDFTLDQSIHDDIVIPVNFRDFPMYLVNPDIANNFFRNNRELFEPRADNEERGIRDDYSLEENIFANYVQLGYNGEKFDFNVGLRYEDTSFSTTGIQKLQEDGTTTFPEITFNSDYDYLLPSFSVIYTPKRDLIFRGAFSQTLGRASYNDLRPNQNRNEEPGTISISGGNPSLLPREATNYDLGFEHYFLKNNGLISLALFHKNIENEIFTDRSTEETTIDGIVTEINRTFPANAESADLTGFEIGLVINKFSFLPGFLKKFGITANYAHISSNATVLMRDGTSRDLYGMLNQPRNIVNASLLFETGKFEAQLAYRFHDERLVAINTSADWRDRFHDRRHLMDLQMRYNISKNLNVRLDIKNLNDSAQVSEINEDLQYRLWERDYGISGWLGLAFVLD